MAAKKPTVDLSEFRRIRKPGCNFANVEIREEHVETLKAAMQAPDISGSGIHDWMKSKGYIIGKEAIIKHRTGRCSCP